MTTSVSIPPPHEQTFAGAILHPDLYLWDSWCGQTDNSLDLYCLALARLQTDGKIIHPSTRNQYPFHIRHFQSVDQGLHWRDMGCFQEPGLAADRHDARNIWSGSVLDIPGKGKLAAYTALQQGDDQHPFIQGLATGFTLPGYNFSTGKLLLCPLRDRERILEAAYYLPESASLGRKEGEEGGPILAWRDPYLFKDNKGNLMMAWAAKVSAKQPALGMASINLDSNFSCSVKEILPPTQISDKNSFSQLEVPKLYFDPLEENMILIISTTTRQSEAQPADEVQMHHHLYTAKSLRGPWRSGGTETSILANLDTLFGLSVVRADYSERVLYCMAPYTEQAGEKLQLSFPPMFRIDLKQLDKAAQVHAELLA